MAEDGSGRPSGGGETGASRDGATAGVDDGSDDESSVAVAESEPPAEAFEVLGHEVRLDVVRELAAVRRTTWQWSGRSFAELRRAVGVEDAGNFSYHLDKLRGRFVVEDGDEYVLTNAGMEVAGSVLSGTYTDGEVTRGGELDTACPACETAVEANYGGDALVVRCPEHGTLFGTSLPSAAAEGRSIRELATLGTLSARQDVERARAGACPHCWGRMTVSIPATEVVHLADGERYEPPREHGWVEFECTRCGMVFWLPPGACVVAEPAVVAFLYDHGIDPRGRSYLELPFVAPGSGELVSEDPVRVRIDVAVDGDCLRVFLDGDAQVIDHERA